jgi:hypothetical protein
MRDVRQSHNPNSGYPQEAVNNSVGNSENSRAPIGRPFRERAVDQKTSRFFVLPVNALQHRIGLRAVLRSKYSLPVADEMAIANGASLIRRTY